jgi:hypothetical protein
MVHVQELRQTEVEAQPHEPDPEGWGETEPVGLGEHSIPLAEPHPEEREAKQCELDWSILVLDMYRVG